MRMLKSDSRRRSAVGRISREDGDARLRPFNRPPTTRIRVPTRARLAPARGEGTKGSFARQSSSLSLLVARLQVALAVIAALRTPRRTVAAGLGFICLLYTSDAADEEDSV